MKTDEIKDGAAVAVSAVTFSKNGLVFNPSISFEDWLAVGKKLGQRQKLLSFFIGDWINFGRVKWEQGKYEEAEQEFSQKYGTLANAVYVCQRIEPSRRRENLSFAHHREVAKFDKDEQEYYLDYAEQNGLSSRKLRIFIKERAATDQPEALPAAKTHRAKILGLKAYFMVPDYDNPSVSFEECEFLLSMVIERMEVVCYSLVDKADQDVLSSYKASSFSLNYKLLSKAMERITLSIEQNKQNKEELADAEQDRIA